MPKPLLKIERYSHGARITGYSRELFHKLTIFLERLALKEPRKLPQHQGGHTIMELKKRFYGLTSCKREVFIHRNSYSDLIAFLRDRGVPEERIEVVEIDVPPPTKIELELPSTIQLYDYQVPIVDSLCDDLYSRRLDLQTGLGKTLSSLAAVARLGYRLVVMIPPKYFGLWIEAIDDFFPDLRENDRYVTVSGSAELQLLIEQGVSGELDKDIIMVSSTTYRAYIDNYEAHKDRMEEMGYLVPPTRFHEAIGAGIQINDEIQEDPGLVFRTDIYTNIKKQIYLSATPFTGSDYVTRMIDHMLPEETQCPLPDLDVYVNVMGVFYNEPEIRPKDYLAPFKNSYNHSRYEKQMLKRPRRLKRYLDMVTRLTRGLYVKDRIEGQKLLVLCSTVDFIKVLTKHLQQIYPELQVGAHVSGSDYNKLLSNDITVSTIKSSGTGVDIPDLREVLLLQAIDSEKDNIQILGRLRRLKRFPDVTPRLTYMVCMDIPQHLKYHNSKKKYFSHRVLNHKLARL